MLSYSLVDFSVVFMDTSTCGQEEGGDRTTDPLIGGRATLLPEAKTYYTAMPESTVL